MAELTAWFPPHIKPARVGEYDVRDARGRIFRRACWDAWGNEPCWRTTGIERSIFTDQDLEWRGLATEPCVLCATGFPIEDGYHYGTQQLGMIPVTRCRAAVGVEGNQHG